MHVITRRRLSEFWARHARAETSLRVWYALAKAADWARPQDVKDLFGASVDFLRGNRVVFDVGGNTYRIVAVIGYRSRRIFIRFVGTHAQYDRIDAEAI